MGILDGMRRRHMYDPVRARQCVRRIWQAPGRYHAFFVVIGDDEWMGHWTSDPIGPLRNKDALAEFLDYATHVADNGRKVGMIPDDADIEIYALHDAQMDSYDRILDIPRFLDDDGKWMKVTHGHPFVPDSYSLMEGFDEFGKMDYSDIAPEIRAAMEGSLEASADNGMSGVPVPTMGAIPTIGEPLSPDEEAELVRRIEGTDWDGVMGSPDTREDEESNPDGDNS